MSDYVVTGACASLTSLVNGKPVKTLLYRGALVPDSATVEEIEHHLACGLIGPREVIASLDEVVLLEPAPVPAVVVEEPARNASTDEWRAYAIASGASPEDVADLKRDELIELYANAGS